MFNSNSNNNNDNNNNINMVLSFEQKHKSGNRQALYEYKTYRSATYEHTSEIIGRTRSYSREVCKTRMKTSYETQPST